MNIRILVLLPAVFLALVSASLAGTLTLAEGATTTPRAATITIRDSDITAFTGIVELAPSTTPPVDITPTDSSTAIPVPADSLLATLVALDATTTDFDITDLAYFSSFGSFIINCIAIPATLEEPHCFNWTYAVNGIFPQVGIDDFLLNDGDTAHLFFGSSRKTILSTTTVTAGESFTATALHYDLDLGDYLPSPDLMLGVGTANPDFTFTELATSTSDEHGEAIFTLTATGTYAVGIAEDFYFPSVSITILDAGPSEDESGESPPPAPPIGGGGGEIVHFKLDIPRALSFLSSAQETDGSFGEPLYTDWVAIAFAAADLPAESSAQAGPGEVLAGQAKATLRTYLEQATPAMLSVTDYERHAMALMALGINPYIDTPIDYITPIVEAFDGTQVGDSSLDNDDIFALFPLLHAGYSASDTIIQKVAEFILSRQGANGSWDESVDMTAAAIQALGPLPMLSGVNAALGRAAGYLVSTQQSDGGWDSIDSTGWVQTAINAINEAHPTPESAWTSSGGLYPNDAIANAQQADGGVRSSSEPSDTRVWSTSYAIVAAAGKNWVTLLQSFPPPVEPSAPAPSGGGGGVTVTIVEATSTTATSTPATSTPLVLGQSTSTETVLAEPVVKSVIQETPTALKEIANVIQIIDNEQTSKPEENAENSEMMETQLAAAGATGESNILVFLIPPLILVLSALLGAFAYPPLMRLFSRVLG